ncbi:MAG: hypothetical protein CL790_07560 [Chloroflexi bacterium]|nr:hypothetical protein [Chloroflexota bacterium]HCU72740.1 hypothetical protein [Chloroflexota bacterium]
MITNTAKQRMQDGKVALGAVTGLGAPFTAELLARMGFDWVLIDNQHGSWDRYSSMLGFMAVRAGGSIPIVRVPENDYYAIGRLLDEGALGVIVPMVDNPDEAERVAFASRYPPAGGRSVGAGGASAYEPGYGERFNDEVFVAIQLESRESIERADDIMAVDGIDGCWLGPADLANSLGHPRHSAEHDEAVLQMVEACQKHGKAAGLAAGDVEQVTKWADAGCTFLSAGSDKGYIMSGGMAELDALSRFRG